MLLRMSFVIGVLFLSAGTASAQNPQSLAWPGWMLSDRFTRSCENTRPFETRALLRNMVDKAMTLDQAAEAQLPEVEKQAKSQQRCLLGHLGARPAAQVSDIERAAANSERDLRAYLAESKTQIRTNPAAHFDRSVYAANYNDAWLTGDVANIRKYDQYLKPASETCGPFNFPAKPVIGNPEIGRKLRARRDCHVAYLFMIYPGENPANFSPSEMNERFGRLRDEGVDPGNFQMPQGFAMWRCKGKGKQPCFASAEFNPESSNGRGRGDETMYLDMARQKLAAFAPYACGRFSSPNCVPDSKTAPISKAVNDPAISQWAVRVERERHAAKVALAQIEEYVFLWRFGKTRDEYIREQSTK